MSHCLFANKQCLYFFLVGILSMPTQAWAEELPWLFTIKADSVKEESRSTDSGWQIQLNTDISLITPQRIMRFSLPDGSEPTLEIRSVTRSHINDEISLTAKLQDSGMLVLTMGKRSTWGVLVSERQSFTLYTDQQNRLMMADYADHSQIDLRNDFVVPPPTSGRANLTANQVTRTQASGDVSVIDILVVYSSEFDELFNNQPLTRINQLIAFTNAAFVRSGILIELRLVEARELDFDNGMSNGDILDDVQGDSGEFSGLSDLRNDAGADLVAVLTSGPARMASGIAFIGRNANSANFAFSTTRLSLTCCDVVFAHEIGHNLGSGHQHNPPEGRSACNTDTNFMSFACGHTDNVDDTIEGTIMATGVSRDAFGFRFSSTDPNDCAGVPCGIAGGQPDSADNRTAFNMSRLMVENYRDAATMVPPILPTDALLCFPIVSRNGGVLQVCL